MTTTEQLTAGRELDALIAEKVMGWTNVRPKHWSIFGNPPVTHPGSCPDGSELNLVPNYSTDIAAAWRVVEKLRNDHGMIVELVAMPEEDEDAHYSARVFTCTGITPDEEGLPVYDEIAQESCLSAPQAICRAALAAIESEAANA